jgi:hypothetical protein
MKSFVMLGDEQDNVLQVNLPERGAQGCCGGFEDARVLSTPGGRDFYMIANARSDKNCMSEMHLIKIKGKDLKKAFAAEAPRSLDVKDSQIIPLSYDDGSGKKHHEKNWMPFFTTSLEAKKDGSPPVTKYKLHFVYSVNPHIILACNTDTGICTKVAETFNPALDKSLRGSSQVRMYNGKYVAVAHIRTSSHSYLSQVYTFSPQPPFAIEEVSPTFIFDDEKKVGNSMIQFVSGFEIKDDIAYITYGEHDCDSKLFKTSMSSLMSSLIKV